MSAVKAYSGFIPENTAIEGAKAIGVYKNGRRVGHVPLGPLKKDMGRKLYSFGAVSDIHLGYDTAVTDCQKAFEYYNNNEDIAFLCICGDLTINGLREELEAYKSMVDTYIPDKTVYVSAGNHEEYSANSSEYYAEMIGRPLCYSFEHGDDLCIMCGVCGSWEDRYFEEGQLAWLENLLKENSNKRVFLFQHIPTIEGSGGAKHYNPNCLNKATTSGTFKDLLRSYPNAIHFHGHTHFMFERQEVDNMANYDYYFGAHSVHIPSLTVPRSGVDENGKVIGAPGLSQGYIVDVYENGIHLRGRDFINDVDIPIASYWLDTTIKTVE